MESERPVARRTRRTMIGRRGKIEQEKRGGQQARRGGAGRDLALMVVLAARIMWSWKRATRRHYGDW
jgi:hypothetical protein